MVRPEIIIGALIGTAFWATCGLFFAVEPSQVKDFAAPIATVLAAGAAAFVAYQLGSGQVAVARTQAEIAERNWRTANEKIVLELFDKRLSIFEEIRAIIGEVTRLGQSPDELLYRYQKAIDRVPYFFGEEVQQFLEQIRLHMIELNLANTMMQDKANPDFHKWVQKRSAEVLAVTRFYKESSPLFGPYMKAHQKA